MKPDACIAISFVVILCIAILLGQAFHTTRETSLANDSAPWPIERIASGMFMSISLIAEDQSRDNIRQLILSDSLDHQAGYADLIARYYIDHKWVDEYMDRIIAMPIQSDFWSASDDYFDYTFVRLEKVGNIAYIAFYAKELSTRNKALQVMDKLKDYVLNGEARQLQVKLKQEARTLQFKLERDRFYAENYQIINYRNVDGQYIPESLLVESVRNNYALYRFPKTHYIDASKDPFERTEGKYISDESLGSSESDKPNLDSAQMPAKIDTNNDDTDIPADAFPLEEITRQYPGRFYIDTINQINDHELEITKPLITELISEDQVFHRRPVPLDRARIDDDDDNNNKPNDAIDSTILETRADNCEFQQIEQQVDNTQ